MVILGKNVKGKNIAMQGKCFVEPLNCLGSNIFFLNSRDTAGQERFRTITTAYYRGAMVSESRLAAILRY